MAAAASKRTLPADRGWPVAAPPQPATSATHASGRSFRIRPFSPDFRVLCGTMAPRHKDRLTAVDASFLAQEGRASHMHVGAILLFDVDPVPRHIEPEPWTPQPLPSTAELVAEGVRDFVNAPLGALRRGIGAVQSPSRALHEVREAAEGLGEVAWANLNPAPELPLNVEIGPHRRIRWVRSTLADFKRAKNELGGTVNDVVLTVVAGALRRWLTSRGVRTEGLELRALVPVSIRTEADEGALGNRIAAMRGPLPVYVDDPVERLNIVREAMEGLKESKQALGAEVIAGLSDFAPPTILAQASR